MNEPKTILGMMILLLAWSFSPFATAQHDEHDHDDHEGHDPAEHEKHAEPDLSAHEGHEHAEPEEKDPDGHDHGDHAESEIHLDPAVMKEFGIEVAVAEKGVLERHLRLPGEVRINQDHTAHIVPRYAGLAVEVLKTQGDDVREGDVLARIEGNESLVTYELKSLMGGTITDRHVTVGESLGEDDVVFVVSNLDSVWIDLALFQKDLPFVKKGQTVVLSGEDHLPAGEGIIFYVRPTLDEHTRTGLVRVELPNPERRWKPGMFVVGDVLIPSEKNVVLISREAVLTVENVRSVFVLNDEGAFEPRPVELGHQQNGLVEILSGLEPGERYAARNVLPLKAELNRSALEHAGHAH